MDLLEIGDMYSLRVWRNHALHYVLSPHDCFIVVQVAMLRIST